MSDRTEYISREAAVSICDNAIDLWNGLLGAGALVAVRDAIKALPSAVVRCADCYHYNEEYGQCLLNDSDFKPTDYCSYGSI